MRARNLPYHGEADSGTRDSVTVRSPAVKPFEYSVGFRGRDPWAVITDPELHIGVSNSRAEPDGRFAGRMLQSVIDELAKRELDQVAINVDIGQIRYDRVFNRPVFQPRAHLRGYRVDHLVRRDQSAAQFEFSALDA
jgi:hypothetical protein